jgi:hypothetical protein
MLRLLLRLVLAKAVQCKLVAQGLAGWLQHNSFSSLFRMDE